VFARAAEKTFRLLRESTKSWTNPIRGCQDNLFERYLVSGIIHVPFGAIPVPIPRAMAGHGPFQEIRAPPATERRLGELHLRVHRAGEQAYLEKVGGAERVSRLKPPVF